MRAHYNQLGTGPICRQYYVCNHKWINIDFTMIPFAAHLPVISSIYLFDIFLACVRVQYIPPWSSPSANRRQLLLIGIGLKVNCTRFFHCHMKLFADNLCAFQSQNDVNAHVYKSQWLLCHTREKKTKNAIQISKWQKIKLLKLLKDYDEYNMILLIWKLVQRGDLRRTFKLILGVLLFAVRSKQ